jgi:ABC-type cobalamin/Fe3+-siderophores transport system ATPase subunit
VLEFNAGVRSLAQSHGAVLLDHTLMREYEDRRLWAADKIHMNSWGHKRMAAFVLRELEVPHTLRVRELVGTGRRTWTEAARDELGFLRTEVAPLVRRRVTGRNGGDTATAKWPQPVRPADGLRRLARQRSAEVRAGR